MGRVGPSKNLFWLEYCSFLLSASAFLWPSKIGRIYFKKRNKLCIQLWLFKSIKKLATFHSYLFLDFIEHHKFLPSLGNYFFMSVISDKLSFFERRHHKSSLPLITLLFLTFLLRPRVWKKPTYFWSMVTMPTVLKFKCFVNWTLI